MNDREKIKKMLEGTNGKVTIKVKGLNPEVKGDFNRPGALMIVMSAMQLLEMTRITDSWEETIDLINKLHEISSCKVVVHENKCEERK